MIELNVTHSGDAQALPLPPEASGQALLTETPGGDDRLGFRSEDPEFARQMRIAEAGMRAYAETLRDLALDSALARPRQVLAYAEADPVTLAAAYAVGIARNHPRVDGNKRMAFMAAYVFLARNGLRLTATPAEATRAFLALVAGTLSEAALIEWLREHTESVSS